MSKFQAGDRVIYTGDFTEVLKGQIGTVVGIKGPDENTIEWDTAEAKAVKVFHVLDESISLYEDKKDPVAKPAHYNIGTIECIDYLKDNMPKDAFIGYLEGNVKKYLHRWRYKVKPTEDLKKAQWYLDRLIKEVESA